MLLVSLKSLCAALLNSSSVSNGTGHGDRGYGDQHTNLLPADFGATGVASCVIFFKMNLYDFSVCLSPLVPGAFTAFPCVEKTSVSFNTCPAALKCTCQGTSCPILFPNDTCTTVFLKEPAVVLVL